MVRTTTEASSLSPSDGVRVPRRSAASPTSSWLARTFGRASRDFLIPSYLDKHYVIWAIVGRLARDAGSSIKFLPRKPISRSRRLGELLWCCRSDVGAHLLSSPVSADCLWARHWRDLGHSIRFGALGSESSSNTRACEIIEHFSPTYWLFIPAWLVYFSQVQLTYSDLTLEAACNRGRFLRPQPHFPDWVFRATIPRTFGASISALAENWHHNSSAEASMNRAIPPL